MRGSCAYNRGMATINVVLPETLEAFAAEQARRHGLAGVGDYLRTLLDAARRQVDEDVEAKLIEGLDSERIDATPEFWDSLRTEAAGRRAS